MDKVRRAGILGTGRYVPDLCPTSSRGSVQKTHRKACHWILRFPGAMKARESPQGGDFFFKHVRNFKQVLTYNNR